MRVKVGRTLFGLTFGVAVLTAQGPPPAGQGGRRGGGFVPGQQRPPGDPAQIARGKTLYGISCTGCHGADLRGGDIGGPNLLRSQVALSDRDGELIVPMIQGSRKDSGHAGHRYEPGGCEGRGRIRPQRPGDHRKPGHAALGRPGAAEYAGGRCRARAGVLQGEVRQLPFRHRRPARHRHAYPDPKMLQNTWVAAAAVDGADAGAAARRRVNAPER